MTNREVDALAVVREVFTEAKWHHGELFVTRGDVLYDKPELDGWLMSTCDPALWTPEALRAVLRALDILNGVEI